MKVEPQLKLLLENYILDPSDPERNVLLAIYYDHIGQTASAVSFYLRTAERTPEDLLKYECLIRAALCFERQGSRRFTVKGLLQHAVSIMPARPEAYYHLSRFYENQQADGHWNDAFTIASIGEVVSNDDGPPTRTDLNYPGKDGLTFQKALSAWQCGLCTESRNIFKKLLRKEDLSDDLKKLVENNLKFIKTDVDTPFETYNKFKHQRLKHKFPGSENIEVNFSESYQDMFVLTVMNGKRDGTFLEIGAGAPFYGSNTVLLEQFGWRGMGIDINPLAVSFDRKTPCMLKDAMEIDYVKLIDDLKLGPVVDYLQLDCDPAEVTYDILKKIPFDKFKFRIITYEHDYYNADNKEIRIWSREFLKSKGYHLLVTDIAPDHARSYEDWWIHPDLVDAKIIREMTDIRPLVKKSENYLLNL
jgi:hypothetical protein